LAKANYRRLFIILDSNDESAISALEKSDTMEERIGRIRQIETDFFYPNARILSKKSKKIRLDQLNPPNPFSNCIAFYSIKILYMIKSIFTYSILILLNINVLAQKILKLDSGINPNAMIFQEGSEIVFQLAGEKNNWHRDQIEAIDTEKKQIRIATGIVSINDITAIRNLNPYPFLRKVSGGLKIFAISGSFWSGIGVLKGDEASKNFFIFSSATGLTGWILGICVRHKTYYLGKNRRSKLHALDLTPA
jgi:hypothetical protein